MSLSLHMGLIVVLFMMVAGMPLIAAAVAYLASRGIPKTFDREMYWTAFATAGIVSAVFFVRAHKLLATSPGSLLSAVYLLPGMLLFGLSMGCGIGIFTWKPAEPSAEKKTDLPLGENAPEEINADQ